MSFLLDYAASLGITKDITRTQAYSVWLQGTLLITIDTALNTTAQMRLACSFPVPGQIGVHLVQEPWCW